LFKVVQREILPIGISHKLCRFPTQNRPVADGEKSPGSAPSAGQKKKTPLLAESIFSTDSIPAS